MRGHSLRLGALVLVAASMAWGAAGAAYAQEGAAQAAPADVARRYIESWLMADTAALHSCLVKQLRELVDVPTLARLSNAAEMKRNPIPGEALYAMYYMPKTTTDTRATVTVAASGEVLPDMEQMIRNIIRLVPPAMQKGFRLQDGYASFEYTVTLVKEDNGWAVAPDLDHVVVSDAKVPGDPEILYTLKTSILTNATKCAKCQKTLEDEWRFCPGCGEKTPSAP